MTNSQFDLFIMHSGMMQEGLKSEEALAFILKTKLSTAKDIAWLVEHRAMSAAARQSVRDLKLRRANEANAMGSGQLDMALLQG